MLTSRHSRKPTDKAVSAYKVLGTWVYNTALERLGVVHDINIDRASGRVSSVLLRTGGPLHLHHHSYPLPWASLDYSTELGGYIADFEPNELQGNARGHGLMKPFS